MTYADKLKSPKWQRKRLQVLERDNWTCKSCGDTETTLHVHHHIYNKGAEPWEYDDRLLTTYCEECHSMVETIKNSMDDIRTIVSKKIKLSDERVLVVSLVNYELVYFSIQVQSMYSDLFFEIQVFLDEAFLDHIT